MKAPLILSLAALATANVALAGSIVAPGPVGSPAGALLPLPGLTAAIQSGSGTAPINKDGVQRNTLRQPVFFENPPLDTLNKLRQSPGAKAFGGGAFRLSAVEVRTADGLLLVDIESGPLGTLTLKPVAVQPAPASTPAQVPQMPPPAINPFDQGSGTRFPPGLGIGPGSGGSGGAGSGAGFGETSTGSTGGAGGESPDKP
jgi:hypothetical protein